MSDDQLQRILNIYRTLSAREWGLRAARGLLSGVPIVGGLAAEALSPAIEAMSVQQPIPQPQVSPRSLPKIVIAACTFDPNSGHFLGHGLSSYADNGTGDFNFNLSTACEDYLVNAQIEGGFFDIVSQSSDGFRMKTFDRNHPDRPSDRPIKFLVLNASA